MVNMREWLSRKIRRICHQLDHQLFLSREMRARLKAELSSLVDQRESFDKFHAEQEEEKKARRKDPNWGK